jgi:hypothetical protein
MQVGCGVRTMVIKGRDYVYFWHYEDRGGRSKQVYEYMGPRRLPRTARRLADSLESYYARSTADLRRQHARLRLEVAAIANAAGRGKPDAHL